MVKLTELKRFAMITGAVCVALGVLQFVLGATGKDAADDSNERFGAGLLIGFGVVWMLAARRSPLPVWLLRMLAIALLLGGLGRLVSLTILGWPTWWQITQTAVEIVVPIVVLMLARTTGPAPSSSQAAQS